MSVPPLKLPKKLIEVALPLDAINEAAAREKSIRHGHPSTLHLWWARRPLAATRAVIFAQFVNDPGFQPTGFRYGKNKKDAEIERKRLFKIIENLVQWKNTNNEEVLEAAREEIRRSWREVCELNRAHPQAAELFNPAKLPGLHDPFAGGGAIPLEAQRLGLDAFASDLNPVAVLINKAMIEIPPRFAGRPPVGPVPMGVQMAANTTTWPRGSGLAEDLRRYGAWMRVQAEKRVGHLYPPVMITAQMAHEQPDLKPLIGQKLTVIAWIWARTVQSPNPAFSHVSVPLASTFILSSREGKEAYIEPVVHGDTYRFTIKLGKPPPRAQEGTKLARGANFKCLVSGAAIDSKHIKSEAVAGRMGARMMAVVVEGPKGRVYVPPDDAMEELAQKASPQWRPDLEFAHNSRHFTPWAYGLDNFGLLFSNRQLAVLDTFSDLITDVLRVVKADAILAGLPDDGVGIDAGGSGASAYAGAVALLLAFAVNRVVDRHSTIATWDSSPSKLQLRNTFARQALAMTWDFGEGNPFCDSSGTWNSSVDFVAKAIGFLPARQNGHATQADAQTQNVSMGKVVSTDPPYYDNVPYADLSDFFYVWMRHSLRDVFPNIFSTIGVPKAEELVADPFRHNGKQEADYFFLMGMTKAIQNFANQAHPAFPIAIYYAFKQSETDNEAGTTSTGWETFLAALLSAGLTISGTWPMRTELGNRMRSSESNALASSIVLVCNKRPIDAPTVSRREFLRELNNVLPNALDEMVRGSGEDRSPVAPVDLSQAVIGPGMAVFSKYTAVLEANGDQMTVRTALQLINRFLTEDDFDHDTQFCLHWFEQHGWREGAYGEADVLARAKGTSVNGLEIAGVIESSGGKVRILKYEDYRPDWDPRTDKRLPMWEALHHLIRLLRHGGESEAGRVLAVVRDRAEPIRQLAYRLYTLCERAGAAEDARAYNELVNSWSAIEAAAGTIPPPPAGQMDLFGGGSKP